MDSEQLRCPEVMTVNGREWQLVGRIYSTKEWGCHFYAIIRTNVVPLRGFYVYNDLVKNGRARFHSLNLEEQCKLSRVVFYTLKEGTAGNDVVCD